MPTRVQCQTCGLAFNTGISGIGDFSQFAYCSHCGISHVVWFRVHDGRLRRIKLEYDVEGPRVLPLVLEKESENELLDLTRHSPVAPADAMQTCNSSAANVHDNAAEMFAALTCGGCGKMELRYTIGRGENCPNCLKCTLEEVGGWL